MLRPVTVPDRRWPATPAFPRLPEASKRPELCPRPSPRGPPVGAATIRWHAAGTDRASPCPLHPGKQRPVRFLRSPRATPSAPLSSPSPAGWSPNCARSHGASSATRRSRQSAWHRRGADRLGRRAMVRDGRARLLVGAHRRGRPGARLWASRAAGGVPGPQQAGGSGPPLLTRCALDDRIADRTGVSSQSPVLIRVWRNSRSSGDDSRVSWPSLRII